MDVRASDRLRRCGMPNLAFAASAKVRVKPIHTVGDLPVICAYTAKDREARKVTKAFERSRSSSSREAAPLRQRPRERHYLSLQSKQSR